MITRDNIARMYKQRNKYKRSHLQPYYADPNSNGRIRAIKRCRLVLKGDVCFVLKPFTSGAYWHCLRQS